MIAQDLRFAIRSLRKSPGFVLIATFTLGMGIALTTTTFSLIDTVKHPYLAVREPERLFYIYMWGSGISDQTSRYEKYRAVREGTRSFEFAGTSSVAGIVRVENHEEDARAIAVTENYFAVLGVQPVTGRLFAPGPTDPEETSAIISYQLWQRTFLKRPLDSDLSLTIGNRAYNVIGVLPREMPGLLRPDVWVLLAGMMGTTDAQRAGAQPIVRLQPGVTADAARAELAVVAARLTSEFGTGRQPFGYQLFPLLPPPDVLSNAQKALAAAAFAILLIACANLANLMLARSISRRRELSVRLALGATRQALVRHVLAESAVIAAAGGVIGTAMMVWGIGFIRANLPPMVLSLGNLAPHFSWRVYAFVVSTTALSTLAFGLAPAIRASDISLSEPLKEGAGTMSGRGRHRYSALVIVEVAACLVLLMGAGLMLRAVRQANRFEFGYDAEHIYSAMRNFSGKQVPTGADVAKAFDGLLERVRGVQGVTEAATSRSQMPNGGTITSDIEGAKPTFTNVRSYDIVSPAYLRVVGVSILSGRDFEPGDQDGKDAVAIVDERAAAMLWPAMSAVGRMLKLGDAGSSAEWVRVIGIARRVNYSPDLETAPNIYVVHPHDEAHLRTIVVRINADKQEAERIGRDVSRVAWGRAAGNLLTSWSARWEEGVRASRFMSRVFMTLGSLALLLTAIGLYGVLAYAVSQRMREFAVRIALGAESHSLLSLVLRDGAVMVLAGTAIGAGVAMLANPMLGDWLAAVHPTDAVSLVAAEILLIGVSLGACLIPARRATRADPMEIIRAL